MEDTLAGEMWKVVPFDTRFEASSLGRIKNLITGNITFVRLDSRGRYLQINKRFLDGRKIYSAHRMVAAAFFGESNLTVDHINGCKTDNRVENLEYVTPEENLRRSIANKGVHRH